MSICEEIESHLPEKIEIEEIIANHDVAERTKLLLKYLIEECSEYNANLAQVKSDLGKLLACLNGNIVHNVEDIKLALANNKVPKSWQLYWTEHAVLDWTKDLSRRVHFMRKALTE